MRVGTPVVRTPGAPEKGKQVVLLYPIKPVTGMVMHSIYNVHFIILFYCYYYITRELIVVSTVIQT